MGRLQLLQLSLLYGRQTAVLGPVMIAEVAVRDLEQVGNSVYRRVSKVAAVIFDLVILHCGMGRRLGGDGVGLALVLLVK